MSNNLYDIDPIETQEWLTSIQSVLKEDGIERANFLINQIIKEITKNQLTINNFINHNNNYVNTISIKDEPKYPGNLDLEHNICSAIRWNAVIMVLRASNKKLDLGGHISSFQSSAIIYEVCFNHFFRASNILDGGDLIYFQGHISPGIYARAFIEGRLTEEQMNNFRQEINKKGLSSYPHPKLMPEFWQFPTVSMGLSSINAIYQAKFLKYLQNRKLKDTSNQTVYAFLGDGEMDEPESKGAINVAYREKLDNLIFVINCNLQRLDGPVFGNGKIINELENIFNGAGWEVIKVVWNSNWDYLLQKDTTGKLVQLMNETVDGDYQTFSSKDANYIRKHFFGKYKETADLIKNMSDDDILKLGRGGHDPKKIYAALQKAKNVINKPTVILMHTIKGYGMGTYAEGMNVAHQIKKIDIQGISLFRDRLKLNNIIKDKIESLPYVKFSENSEEFLYLHTQRKKLYGYLPKRLSNSTEYLNLPIIDEFKSLLGEQKKNISTTIAFVRILNILLRNKDIKDRIVPIIADEGRTFGMESLFRQIGIYNINGQKYIPQDIEQILYYKEDKKGQILQEGISESGATSSWIAAATSYSNNNFIMIPFYIYYSIFGFQRVGDLFWAAGDQQARGFLIGGTSGRTTLNGEGLQHQDGHSHIQSLTIPNCISYDPAYAYELAVIIHHGLIQMYGKNPKNIYYYLTVTNENYYMPAIPKGVEEGICKGIYKLETINSNKAKVQLMGSGAILKYVREAALILFNEYGIGSDVYSVTSFTEIARDGQNCIRWNLLHPHLTPRIPYISKIMNSTPTIASTDYMKLFAEQIRNFIPTKNFFVLGTDGFGCSDSRENLRNYFEISTNYIVFAALNELVKVGNLSISILIQAMNKLHINVNKVNPCSI